VFGLVHSVQLWGFGVTSSLLGVLRDCRGRFRHCTEPILTVTDPARRSPADDALAELLSAPIAENIATARATTAPIGLGVVEIPAYEVEFAAPDRLDISRKTNPHLAFGCGIHRCLGTPLARLESEAAIGGLLPRFDMSTLQEGFTPRYRTGLLMRSVLTLPVRLQRAEREPRVVAGIA
jgi:hypothetical protein